MSTELDHVEVAPRMWDKTIAAPYHGGRNRAPPGPSIVAPRTGSEHAQSHPQQPLPPPSQQPPPPSQQPPFFTRWKNMIAPALLIVAILMAVYVLWKYYTKYRSNKKTVQTLLNQQQNSMARIRSTNPLDIVRSTDVSKYVYDTDDEEDEERPCPQNKNVKVHFDTEEQQREVGGHGTEEEQDATDDTGEEEDEGDDDSCSDDTSDKEDDAEEDDTEEDSDAEERRRAIRKKFLDFPIDDPDAPDFKKIEELIKDSNVPLLEQTSYITDTDNDTDSPPKSSRKSRKLKRVTL